MALDYVSFYTITGEEIKVPNLVAQMIDIYNQKLQVGETKITDFNEGSEIRNLLEAIAVGEYALLEQDNEFAKLPFIRLSYGTFLDLIGENPFINLPRIEGVEAYGNVTFTLSETQETSTVIPAGTVVVDSFTGLEFTTDNDCTIGIGETTGDVMVTCLTVGADGNSASGDINLISDVNTDINRDLLTVTNSDAFTTGKDYEDDEDYRIRLLENVRAEGFGSLPYYEKLCESVDGVHDVLFVNATGYTRKCLVNGYTKPVDSSIVLNVLSVLSAVDDKVLNHNFTADAVSTTIVNFTLNLQVTANISGTDLLKNLTAYVNGTSYDRMEYAGLNINEALTIDGIRSCLEVFPEFVSVTGTYNGSALSSITPETNKALKLGSITFNQTVV